VEDFRGDRVENFRCDRVEDFRGDRVEDFRGDRVEDFRCDHVVDLYCDILAVEVDHLDGCAVMDREPEVGRSLSTVHFMLFKDLDEELILDRLVYFYTYDRMG